jgi:hypothetical protein
LIVSLLYLLFRRALAVAALRLRSRKFKELEIVVLRHELAVLGPWGSETVSASAGSIAHRFESGWIVCGRLIAARAV